MDTDTEDHLCDLCGETLGQCADENSDGKCDICDADIPGDSGNDGGDSSEPDSSTPDASDAPADSIPDTPDSSESSGKGKKKKGCRSSIAGAGVGMIMLVGAAAVVFSNKRKED